MDAEASLYEFAEEDAGAERGFEGLDMKAVISAGWVDPPKRERKKNYNENEYYREVMVQAPRAIKATGPKITKLQTMSDFQFYEQARINQLYNKEVTRKHYEWQRARQNEELANHAVPSKIGAEEPGAPQPLSEEERETYERLLGGGFNNWNRRDFQAFCRACEKFGRADPEGMTNEIEGKTLAEVRAYNDVFWTRYEEVAEFPRIIANIEKGETKIHRQNDMLKAVRRKIETYKNPWRDLKLVYGPNKVKSFTEEEDRFLLCSIPEVGFGNWEELKAQIRQHWLFRFDWFIKSRTPKELGRRVETLINLVEKEFEDLENDAKAKRRGGGGGGGGGNGGGNPAARKIARK